jgi:ABC-2 type transport system permease protein
MIRRILALAAKELRQAARDPLSLTLLLALPALLLLLYGFALNFDVRDVALAVEDRDRTAASRALVDAFAASTYFEVVETLDPGDDPERSTARGRARAVLVLPPGLGADLAAGHTVPLQFLVDGADARIATTVLGYAAAAVGDANAGLARERLGEARRPAIEFRPRVWYNPELESLQFLVPGMMGFLLMITAVVATALSLVREKEQGTMEQLSITALSPVELVVGKLLPFLGVSLAASGVVLLAARVVFDMRIQGRLFDLFLVTLLYLIGALAWGLFVSILADSQAMAFQIGALSAMLPAIFLSGFIFPLGSMPRALQVLSLAVPARYYLIVLRGVILKGAGLAPYWEQLVFLALFAVAVLGLASLRLVRQGS